MSEPINYGAPWALDSIPHDAKIVGEIVKVFDSFTVLINKGANHGVEEPAEHLGSRKGMKFSIRERYEVDSETYSREVALVEAVSVKSDHCVCRTYWQDTQGRLENLVGRNVVPGIWTRLKLI